MGLTEHDAHNVRSHFLDSGAFTQYGLVQKKLAKKYKSKSEREAHRWDYFDTKAFYRYMDAYAAFVKEHKIGIDFYANVDAIGNPALSYRNLKYLEEQHDLKPVPIIHNGTDLKWIERHIREGYDYIGFGVSMRVFSRESTLTWLDKAFDLVCSGPGRLPRVKIHGFGITSIGFLFRYPFFSTDSTTWALRAGYGSIIVPLMRRDGTFFADRFPKNKPQFVNVSDESPYIAHQQHTRTMTTNVRAWVEQWLEKIDVPLGRRNKKGEIVEAGVTNCYIARRRANLLFFEWAEQQIEPWPWAFPRPTQGKFFF